MSLTQHKDMKNLTIIDGLNEKFILIDTESNNYSFTAYYVTLSAYNDGFFNDDDLISKTVYFMEQKTETINGWLGYNYDQPNFQENISYPGDDDFDYSLAEKTALEATNELIYIHEKDTAHV